MNGSMLKQATNGTINTIDNYDKLSNGRVTSSTFDDDFVTKTNSQVRNRSFKPPSPLFPSKTENDTIKDNSCSNTAYDNGKVSSYYANEFLNKRESLNKNRSRRTSTPPLSSDFDEIECNTTTKYR